MVLKQVTCSRKYVILHQPAKLSTSVGLRNIGKLLMF